MNIISLPLFFFTLLTVCIQPNCWRGITPLKSTCDDVKKILRVDTCLQPPYQYTLEDYKVMVSFAEDQCDRSPHTWRVPKGTVLSLVITPQKPITPAELGFDLSKFKRSETDVVGMDIYDHPTDGLGVVVFQNHVQYFSLRPRQAEEKLRCKARNHKTH